MTANPPRATVIIDCDPGIDDAIALMAALAPGRSFDIVGITAVAGNLPLAVTYPNARALCAFLGRHDVPVYAGADRPLVRAMSADASDIHGRNGLGGLSLPVPTDPEPSQSAVDFIVETCRAGPTTLCPVGPLTTIAQALRYAPDICDGIERIVLMGGAAFVPGNVTDVAEFNVWADPDAAVDVFAAPVEKVMIGLDATMKVPAQANWIGNLASTGGKIGQAAAEMLTGYQSRSKALHDPCVPVYLERPELFSGVSCTVQVVTETGDDYGRTVATPNAGGDVFVLTDADADGVRAHVAAAIAALDNV